jgi:hypothetical protein
VSLHMQIHIQRGGEFHSGSAATVMQWASLHLR